MSDPFLDFIDGAVSDVLEARWYSQPEDQHLLCADLLRAGDSDDPPFASDDSERAQ